MNSNKAAQTLRRKASIYGGLLAPVALALALGVSAAAQVAATGDKEMGEQNDHLPTC